MSLLQLPKVIASFNELAQKVHKLEGEVLTLQTEVKKLNEKPTKVISKA